VCNIPGTKRKFSLKGYKEELGMPYSKITLFVCLTVSLVNKTDVFNVDDGDDNRYGGLF